MAKKTISYDNDGKKVIEIIAEGIINGLLKHAITAYDKDKKRRYGREQIIIEIEGLGEEKDGEVKVPKGSEIEIRIRIKSKD